MAALSAEEYLASSYVPDREYVDGILVERSVATIPDSVLAKLLILHFGKYEAELGFEAPSRSPNSDRSRRAL